MQLRSLDVAYYERSVLPIIKGESSWLCNSSYLSCCWFSKQDFPVVQRIYRSVSDTFAVLAGNLAFPLLFPLWNTRDSRKEPRRNWNSSEYIRLRLRGSTFLVSTHIPTQMRKMWLYGGRRRANLCKGNVEYGSQDESRHSSSEAKQVQALSSPECGLPVRRASSTKAREITWWYCLRQNCQRWFSFVQRIR